jgi:alpha-D-xyloside xylohydrolase
MGERFDALNQKGRRVINKVEECFCHQKDKMYCPAPFFFTDSGFGLCIDTQRVSAFDFCEEITACFVLNTHLNLDADKIETADFPAGAEIVLFSGSPAAIIADYMALSGPAGAVRKRHSPLMTSSCWGAICS